MHFTPYYAQANGTGVSHYQQTFGHEVVIPVELQVHNLRASKKYHFVGQEFTQAVDMELEELLEAIRLANNKMISQKVRIA